MAPTMDSIPSPLLRVCKVRLCIPVCRNELAAGILTDAERRVLDLVVVDMPVKAHHHCFYLRATICAAQRHPRSRLGTRPAVKIAAEIAAEMRSDINETPRQARQNILLGTGHA